MKQDATHLHYRATWPDVVYPPSPPTSAIDTSKEEDTESLVRHYFNLSPNLTELYEQWSSVDPNFKKRAPKFTGIRILKQDAWEAIVGFICSSNNNIVRISQMVSFTIILQGGTWLIEVVQVNNLCLHYGSLIGRIDGHLLHDFPTAEALARPGIEAHLRELGFGYRAKYIARTAEIVTKERPNDWLRSLSNDEGRDECSDQEPLPKAGREGYRKAHEALLELQGVGPKVADCICLMGLGWTESVPVDTHVWQIAQRDYRFGKGSHKSLTKATYDAVGDHFRRLWGKEAGWAHSVLFAADLKTFSERLTTKVEVEVEETKTKQEDGSLLESKVAVKRQYTVDVKNELEEEAEKISTVVESARSVRAKRRRLWDIRS